MNNFAKKLNILIILVAIFLPLFFVSAQPVPNTNTTQATSTTNRINYIPLAPISGVTDEGSDTTNIGSYLGNLFNFLVGLAAILAVFIISLGGFLYISSDSFTGKTTGREFISNALWGLLIVLSAYIVLYTINPDLLKFNLNPSERDLPPEEQLLETPGATQFNPNSGE